MRQLLLITKALSDETRVRALATLHGRELCLCQIVAILALAPSTVSKHMTLLHRAGLVARRKEGRWHYFRLADGEGSPTVRKTLRWIRDALAGDPAVARDARTLEGILQMDMNERCGRNSR